MNTLLRAAARPDEPAKPDELDGRRAALVAAARDARFRNPELVARILAADEGQPAQLVRRLGEAEPYLIEPTMTDLLRSAVRRE